MKTVVDTGLPDLNLPLEWAVLGEGKTLYTTCAPIRPDGSIEFDDPLEQFEITVANIKRTVEAAGGTLDDVTMAQVFMTDAKYSKEMNEVWVKYFKAPYPHRAVVIVSGFSVPVIVEICIWAQISS